MMKIETNELTIDQLNCVHGAGRLYETTLADLKAARYRQSHPREFPACKDKACAQ
jgi:hypothetical protein